MEKQAQVLDASVIVKWFVNEIDTDKAVELWNKHASDEVKIIVPSLIFLEVINSLRYKGNSEETLIEINKTLWNSDLKIEPISEQLVQHAIILAKKYDLTIYDAIYVSLAQLHGCSLVTSDKELYKIPNAIPLNKV